MPDIINSVDRSLDMYIYDLYIYRYISLSIYRSIFLYLFWLADTFASVERPDNKSLHLADMILIKLSNLLLGARQHHTTSGSVLFFALAAHGRKVSQNLGTMKKHTLTSCSSISPPMRRFDPIGQRDSDHPRWPNFETARRPGSRRSLRALEKDILFQATEEGLNSSAPLSAPPLNHAPAVWAQRCGAGGCRREATWIYLLFTILYVSFQFFPILFMCSYNSFQFFPFFLTILFNLFQSCSILSIFFLQFFSILFIFSILFNSFHFFLQFFSILFKPFQFFPFFLAIRSNSFQFFCQFQRIVQK